MLNSRLPASSRPAIAQTSTIAAVTSGPAIAILNSVAGVSESFSRRAKPPNIHSVIAGDADVVAAGHEGVAELVEQDRAEEEHGARDREQVGRGVTGGELRTSR